MIKLSLFVEKSIRSISDSNISIPKNIYKSQTCKQKHNIFNAKTK